MQRKLLEDHKDTLREERRVAKPNQKQKFLLLHLDLDMAQWTVAVTRALGS
jgi:hypothetical protein